MPRGKSERVEVPAGGDQEENGASYDATSQEGVEHPSINGADLGAGAEALGAGDGDSGGGTITGSRHPLDDGDPRIIRDENGNPTFSPSGRLRKRRGNTGPREPRQDAGSKAKAVKKVPVDALARLLMMGHAIGANLTRTPELDINSGEAKMLADPLSELLVLYEIEPDPRIMAMMELGMAASYVYGPRVAAIRARLQAETKAKADARKAAGERTIQPDVGSDLIFMPSVNPDLGIQ
jgi:hypothetical protein